MIIITFVGTNSDVFFLYFFFFFFFITIAFYKLFFYLNAVHEFPVYGTIKLYCIVLYCIVLYLTELYTKFMMRRRTSHVVEHRSGANNHFVLSL